MEKRSENGSGIWTVSYTHLDVYKRQGEERYLLLAKQHMQAYVNMGFALNEQNQTIRDIISILDQTIRCV